MTWIKKTKIEKKARESERMKTTMTKREWEEERDRKREKKEEGEIILFHSHTYIHSCN